MMMKSAAYSGRYFPPTSAWMLNACEDEWCLAGLLSSRLGYGMMLMSQLGDDFIEDHMPLRGSQEIQRGC